MVKADPYTIVVLAMAVFFFLCRSVLRLRAGSERPAMTDALFSRLFMISAFLGGVFYVAEKAQWRSPVETALMTPVAAPTVFPPTNAAPAPTLVAPTIAAPIKAPTIAPTVRSSSVADSVPIYPSNNGTSAMIDVVLGGRPLRMVLDTGATTCLVSEEIATRIVRDGRGVRQEAVRFKMADGLIRIMPTVLIREVQIGRHTVRNVRAGVSSTGEMLLAFPVVNAIAPFTIDTRAKLLIFHS